MPAVKLSLPFVSVVCSAALAVCAAASFFILPERAARRALEISRERAADRQDDVHRRLDDALFRLADLEKSLRSARESLDQATSQLHDVRIQGELAEFHLEVIRGAFEAAQDQLREFQLVLSYLERPTLVRVHNATGVDLKHVRVAFPRESFDFGELADGGRSPYRSVLAAGSTPDVEVVTHDGRTLATSGRLCTQFGGELGVGRFTYELSIDGGRLGMTALREPND
jgi:hypothetical protein